MVVRAGASRGVVRDMAPGQHPCSCARMAEGERNDSSPDAGGPAVALASVHRLVSAIRRTTARPDRWSPVAGKLVGERHHPGLLREAGAKAKGW
jgi:hypothetical protein